MSSVHHSSTITMMSSRTNVARVRVEYCPVYCDDLDYAKVDFGLYIMYPPENHASPVASRNSTQSEAFNVELSRALHTYYQLHPYIPSIVAVHGLEGHYRSTWTDEATQICWLEHPQFLPSHVPNARVMSYYYDARIFSRSVSDVKDVARGLIANLRAKRVSVEEKKRPIIFIAHSLGGIVVKKVSLCHLFFDAKTYVALKVIVVAHMQDNELHKTIKAAIFFSVPHQASARWHDARGVETARIVRFTREFIQSTMLHCVGILAF